jgi:hypothetical protein
MALITPLVLSAYLVPVQLSILLILLKYLLLVRTVIGTPTGFAVRIDCVFTSLIPHKFG